MKPRRFTATLPAALFALSLAGGALAESEPPLPPPGIVETGHSALWFSPERDGEGWVLEILDDQRAVIAWFTYDEEGEQRWLYGVGHIVVDAENGQSIVFPELFATEGGRFGPDFDPEAVQYEVVGQLSLRFEDCNAGQLDYSAYGQAQSFPIQRIARTMAAGCAPIHGVTGEPIHELAGQSGSWSDPARDGEGLQLQWTADGLALLGWYTYDDAGKPYWLTGLGQWQGDGEDARIVFPELVTTRGGRFGEAFDPDQVERLPWGNLELAIGCDAGLASFQSSLPEFGSGSRELRRVTRATPAACPWVAPKLTDLYELEFELLTAYGTPQVQPQAITDDGEVFLTNSNGTPPGQKLLIRQSLETGDITPLLDENIRVSAPPFTALRIAPDGKHAVVDNPTGTSLEAAMPLLWTEENGVSEIAVSSFETSRLLGASPSLSHFVGVGWTRSDMAESELEAIPYVSDALGNHRILASSPDLERLQPLAASGDGQKIVGTRLSLRLGRQITPPPGYLPPPIAGLWAGDNMPAALRDSAGNLLANAKLISDDGRVVLGHHTQENPDAGPWYWISEERSGYLTQQDPEVTAAVRHSLSAATADGNLLIGNATDRPEGALMDRIEAFVWTQNTGLTPLRDTLAEQGINLPWGNGVSAASISASGARIVLTSSGMNPGTPPPPLIGVLTLTPKPQRDPRVPVETAEE